MPKLRYKDHDKKKEKKSHRHKHKKEKPYKPPTLYEEEGGWIPPVQSEKESEEAAWREHLFDAMMDDEGQDPFYSRYEHSSQPTPMTDEEYRQYIVDGMYKRTHAEEIAAEEKRKARKEKKRKEREEMKAKMEKEDAERIRIQNVYNQIEELRRKESVKVEYLDKWHKLDTLDIVHKKDIPWPIIGKVFSFENVKLFVIDSKLTQAENKKNVRKEQTRYHPDKFITKYMKKFEGSDKEKDKIMTRINEISGWLNELWTQVNQ